MILISGIFVLILIILFSFLLFNSSSKPKQFREGNNKVLKNSISEKILLEVNGTRLGMFIKGESINNPVILYLHGGIPDYFLTEKFPTQLEKKFVMVWLEQRGCGISINSNSKNKKVTLNQLVDDTIYLTQYLLKRFNQKKIYLMGHSGGTFLGVSVIDKSPELYHAYIGVAQMSDQLKSEKIAHNYMLNKYRELDNHKMVEVLKRITIEDNGQLPDEYVKIRDVAMHELGVGTMKSMKNLLTDLIIPSLLFSEYTISEKFNLWIGKSQSGISQNWNSMTNTNLIETKNSFQIPVYFFHGIADYTCSYEMAEEYFKKINAPVKGFYTFYESAHSPIFEEPIKMNKILITDILNLKTELADKL